MSLSAWEQQALDSIKDGLAGTDPKLAALLATFDRLASGEGMPAREKVQAGRRRSAHRPRRSRASRRWKPTGSSPASASTAAGPDADLMTIMHQGRNTGQQELSSLDRRLSAAESALAVAQEAIAGLRNRVAELGTRR